MGVKVIYSISIFFIVSAVLFMLLARIDSIVMNINPMTHMEEVDFKKDTKGIINESVPHLRSNMPHTNSRMLHISIITEGDSYYNLSLALVKSIVFLTKWNVTFYIFTEDNSAEKLQVDVSNWPQDIQDRISVLKIDFSCKRLKSYFKETAVDYKLCAYETMLNSNIIQRRTSKMIYLDADVIAFDDLGKMWLLFNKFNVTQTISASSGVRYVTRSRFRPITDQILLGGYGINAGIMMIDIGKLRRVFFMQKLISAAKVSIGKLKNNDDQDLLVKYFRFNPQEHMLLPCEWNFRKSMDNCVEAPQINCTIAGSEGIGLLHAAGLKPGYGSFDKICSCLLQLNFHSRSNTYSCLREGIHDFSQYRENECNTSVKYFNRLERHLQTI